MIFNGFEVVMSKKITAIYVRVSSIQQKVDSQADELKMWIDVHQPARAKWYRDKFSGKSMDRPSMQKLMGDLHNGKIDTILIWRLDRLGRTASGLTKLFEELQRYKCNLISLKDHLDLSTPAGRLNANIIASVACYETEVRAERVKAGQASAKARGKKWGGSKKVRKKKTEAKVKSILTLLEQGMSKAQISRDIRIVRRQQE